jgi:hypothetical protein
MGGLRYLLIIASAGTAAFLTFVSLAKPINAPWTVAGFIVACVLNVAYLVLSGPPNNRARASRMSGLFGLWLDAKEAELKNRAKSS